MQLSAEQSNIIRSDGNIKINAVAGSGKTTTLIAYAKSRPINSKILYLAFNKAVKTEAQKKFTEKGLLNVTVETAHSLAFKWIVPGSNYKVRSQGYKTHEIVELLGLSHTGEKHAEYIIANHINKFIAYFCNSNKQKVQDLNYLDVVLDDTAKSFVYSCYPYIERQTRILLNKMDKGQIEISHDFYLKKFQLQQPFLNYDYILFDEAQDASPAMLDVVLKQDATKVIVGDTHQQIYSWRFAINSMEQIYYPNFKLSNSFRFGYSIASVALMVLNWKNDFLDKEDFKITGKGNSTENKTKAIIARTNLGLLLKAIECISDTRKIKKLHFEGNFNSYTYADDGASLYDVLNLYNNKKHLIRDALIKQMKNLEELEEYIEKTDDAQLRMMVEIVREYGNEIPEIINTLKEKHVDASDKNKADLIFSTVHRCKGIEYDEVELVNDFLTKEKLDNLLESEKDIDEQKLKEEINLLYVAVTRSKNILHIPEAILPEGFSATGNVHIIRQVKEDIIQINKPKVKNPDSKTSSQKKTSSFNKKNEYKEAYEPWTHALDEELIEQFYSGLSIKDLADEFGRSKPAIRSRLSKLGLDEDLFSE